jgi:copper resistance protein C
MHRRAFIAIAPLLLLGVGEATAHAYLDHASPLVGSTVATAPSQITLRFTQQLEPSFSTMSVTNSSGQRVDSGRVSVSGNTMRVPIRATGAGTYRVTWRVLSVDTHTTQGSFSFHVGR